MSNFQTKDFKNFEEFYPFYLSQHSNQINRRLHCVGTSLAMLILVLSLIQGRIDIIPYVLFVGYGFAWVGHFFFEKNKPATFKYPLYSFMGDFRMLKDCITGKIQF